MTQDAPQEVAKLVASAVRIWSPTLMLRWSKDGKVLQQKWMEMFSSNMEWRPIEREE